MSKEDTSIINIIYKYRYNMHIFGSEFVKNNKNKCKMLIDDKEYEITEKCNIENYTNNELKIKLRGIDNIIDMSYMFYGCSSLSSLPNISKCNTNKVTDTNSILDSCPNIIISKIIRRQFHL